MASQKLEPKPIYHGDLRIGGVAGRNHDLKKLFELWHEKVDAKEEADVAEEIAKKEAEWKISLPTDLVQIAKWPGVVRKVRDVFPSNNDWLPPSKWELRKLDDGRNAVKFMDENQRCCFWFATFGAAQPGGATTLSSVHVARSEDASGAWLTADSLIDFLVDYTQEGAKWYAEHPPVQKTVVRTSDGNTITVYGATEGMHIDEDGNLFVDYTDSSDDDVSRAS